MHIFLRCPLREERTQPPILFFPVRVWFNYEKIMENELRCLMKCFKQMFSNALYLKLSCIFKHLFYLQINLLRQTSLLTFIWITREFFSSYSLLKILSVLFLFLMIHSLLPIGGTENPYITSHFIALDIFTEKTVVLTNNSHVSYNKSLPPLTLMDIPLDCTHSVQRNKANKNETL